MNDFGIVEMQEMQKALQERYKDKWVPLSLEVGKNNLLWMIGEVGEVIDIIKKNGAQAACDGRARTSQSPCGRNGRCADVL